VAGFYDKAGQKASDRAVVRPEAAAIKVNWVPTVILLGLFFCWVMFAFFSYGRFPDQRAAAQAIACLLFAGVVIAAAPALARQFAPKAPRAALRKAALPICLAVTVPLTFGLFWTSYDALNPVHARPSGQLPDAGALIGRNEHDVARILGNERIVGSAALPQGEESGPSRPGGADARRFVVYSLPDLNTIDQRPEKRASRQAESKESLLQLGGVSTPEQWKSDAVVIVYYDSASKVVGVRTDVSVKSAATVLSNVTSHTVLPAMGVTLEAAAAMPSGEPTGVSSGGLPAADTHWGSGSANNVRVGYALQIGGLASFLTGRARVSADSSADQGDVTLVVAPNLTGTTTPLAKATSPTPPSTQASQSQAGMGGQPVKYGGSSFSDRTFWVLICSDPCYSEEDASRRAKELNAQGGKRPLRFSVERSGHLAGLGTTDYWVVIYDVAYVYQDAASKAVSESPWGFPLSGVTIVNVTKQCGDFTIAKVVD